MTHETGTICINVTLQVRGSYGFADFEQNQTRAKDLPCHNSAYRPKRESEHMEMNTKTSARVQHYTVAILTGFKLAFRHRASCILGQAFHYFPENAFYIFNQQIYFII